MASFAQRTKRKRSRRKKNAGHARKIKLSRKSTPTSQELFAALGEPGKPAPRSAATPAPASKA
ncbi:hypothetical protein [Nannocystis sp.]|uniref:hypothetical protein n=1 Tax=Nannocystis sp. TaxID=1962667 RepID=UPI0024216173|nr:hypothetical protein [Nannocystis sp.]MBK7823940.1 hypothetical protein [Nannocystis sp.]MBK9754951.1 hypothetical protein [Nannocystis sp.]